MLKGLKIWFNDEIWYILLHFMNFRWFEKSGNSNTYLNIFIDIDVYKERPSKSIELMSLDSKNTNNWLIEILIYSSSKIFVSEKVRYLFIK